MNAEQWTRLSEWHNAWLDADPNRREELRTELTAAHPELVAHADDLVAGSAALNDFLETPAFILAARRMARETMAYSPGANVGPYRIVTLIAHGGMGLVYRATDTRLHRDVALKMLAPIDVPDEARVERFLREARVTASIDHPNVVKAFDVGVFEGHPYIVVELLEGETLRARLERGPLAPSEAAGIALDIARALVAAHAVGLVHRDLKPENIFLTRAGVTKVLDFGIAKLAPGPSRPPGTVPTMTGLLLGTPGYLAPEQIRGEDADARADLFALGTILFEMLAGTRAFRGEHTVDTLHAILHEPAPALTSLRADVPPELASIVSRLLEKAPADRFQSAADLAWILERSRTPSGSTPPSLPGTSPRPALPSAWLLIAALAVLGLGGVGWSLMSRSHTGNPEAAPLTRFAWTLPQGTGLFSAPAVSPDGRRICWAASADGRGPQLFVRDMSSLDATAIPGTEGGRQPFWSPDGKAIGFFARGKLQRVSIEGGPPIILADAPDPRGGSWSQSGTIVFAPSYRDAPLMRVSDRGGEVTPVTALDQEQEEVTNRWPAFLPDGIHFVYSVVSLRDDRRGIYLGSRNGPLSRSPQPLFTSESNAVYVSAADPSQGALLSVENNRIELRPFDPVRLMIVGDARTIGIEAIGTTPHHAALVSASADTLAYGGVMLPWGARIASVERDGSGLQFLSSRELGGFLRISPDGRRLARSRVDPLRGNPDVWIDDLQRGTQLRLTTSAAMDLMPVWSPDGRELAFRTGTLTEPAIGFAAADGPGVTRTIPCPKMPCEPNDWSPDGKYLILTVQGRDIWTLPLQEGAAPRPLLAESYTERDARVSPDGQWLAYVSDESGRPEVSVRSLAGTARRFVVSSGGGDQPVWRRDGAELIFAAAEGRLHAVPVRSDGRNGLAFGELVKLATPPLGERHWGTIYDVSVDGRRVFFPYSADDKPPREFHVVLNWRALFQ